MFEPVDVQIAKWAINHKITNAATSDLLKILKRYYDSSLPIDARTLMKTDLSHTTIPLKNVLPGKYYHFGIGNGIKNNYKGNSENHILKLAFGIDGLPLTKSSSSAFWPILCYIVPNSQLVFPVGIYWGKDKPNNSNDFLQDFCKELKELILNGIEIKDDIGNLKKAQIVLQVFYCDVPAKSFVLKTKGHSGFFSCNRCFAEGEYINRRVCFPELTSMKRSHDNFVNKQQEEHHVGQDMSILLQIPGIYIINCFSLDYMHLACLGIMRKLINLWLKGPLKVRINSSKSKLLSSTLILLKPNVTMDFQRKPRGVNEVSRWKATEFRKFFLYLGPVVLKNILSEECYFHFLSFHIIMTSLLTPNIRENLLKFVNELVIYFVRKFGEIYGKEWISHNVHSFQHICDDYRRFGSLDNCSAFPFENYMSTLKKLIRKSNQPLQQVVKQYAERTQFKPQNQFCTFNEIYNCKNQHSGGPLLLNIQTVSQFKVLCLKNTEIKINNKADCYVQTTDKEYYKSC